MSANYTPPNTMTRPASAPVPSHPIHSYSPSGGPLHVSFPNTAAPFLPWGQLGICAIGIPDIQDFLSGSFIGSQYCPLTVRPDDQTRSSSEASFLQTSFARNQLYSNLVVYIDTLGDEIMFDGNKTATGVLVKSHGMSYLLNAIKEVIISAGAFQSPQLLMVNGVGPKEELAKYNIGVIADRPGVGQEMWDHVLFPITHKINISTTSILEDAVQACIASQMYNVNKMGILTINNADYLGWEKILAKYYANLTATTKADLSNFPADWPDIEHFVPSFNPDTYLAANITYGTLEPAIIMPLSRGNISLNSSSMSDAPVINVGWLTNQTDLETAVVAVKRAREFWATPVMQNIKTGEAVLPGKECVNRCTQWAKQHVQTVYHASCTCEMGKLSDRIAVTDSRARVIGVKNLRVADASTSPMLPPENSQSTIYAPAEQIAHHILTGS